jgi:hypothetical protein
MPCDDKRVLCEAKRYVQCGKKNVHQDGLTDMVTRRQKSDVNAVHLVKNLNHVDLGPRAPCQFERSFGDVKNDDYGYDDAWDDDYDIDYDIAFGVERETEL